MAMNQGYAGLLAALRGFVLSAIAAGVVASLVFTATWVIGGADGAQLADVTVDGILSQIVFFGGIAAGTLIVFLAPVTVALARLRFERAWSYPTLGLFIAFALALFIPGPRQQFVDPDFYLSMIALGGFPGMVAGFVWWFSYRKARAHSGVAEALQ